MPRTFPDCPTCTDILSRCIHRQQYEEAEKYIIGAYPPVDIIDMSMGKPDDYWRGGKTVDYKTIWIWRSACRLYGWAMLLSILIHEYGHNLWYDASGKKLEHLEDEVRANEYGFDAMPSNLTPTFYRQYREFFLRSYGVLPVWDEKTCLIEYDHWLRAMFTSSPFA